MTIHILEDDTSVLDALRVLVELDGVRPAVHRSAESFFRSPPPDRDDLVIVDVELPGIGGVAVIRWLRRLQAPPRIVAISAQSEHYLSRVFKREPMPLMLQKPLREDALAAVFEDGRLGREGHDAPLPDGSGPGRPDGM
ncbi:response regulator [Amorphus orientalis]|uniref:FixJ family two-component response regulator n=1 Tax=Amorphus orientalis TaxID=649198 RepID=A0AAE3VND9_9HYPH|nr:response regulator [Amorphus orientalis]MDQ0315304.1 FixJ family two-component response regulator [Amorphus orientalis]